jgi:threonine/homoserine/homoserine lactone efflux protein
VGTEQSSLSPVFVNIDMDLMLSFLAFGAVIGLSAGVSPGPLLTLVISHTLQHGAREGMKIALAPILTDLPIVTAAILLFSSLPNLESVLGIVSFAGCAFVLVLGVQNLLQKPVELELEPVAPRSIIKGILVNLFSPHPYIFWFGLGAPTVLKAYQSSLSAALGFVACFFFFIVGSKSIIALIVGKSRQFLKGRPYLWTMRALGLLLIVFAGVLFYDGLVLLKLIEAKAP